MNVTSFYFEQPNFLENLNHLQELRNSLVHFRLSDVSVIIDNDGIIKHYQEPPEVFNHLKSKKVKNWPILAADVKNNSAWNFRISQ